MALARRCMCAVIVFASRLMTQASSRDHSIFEIRSLRIIDKRPTLQTTANTAAQTTMCSDFTEPAAKFVHMFLISVTTKSVDLLLIREKKVCRYVCHGKGNSKSDAAEVKAGIHSRCVHTWSLSHGGGGTGPGTASGVAVTDSGTESSAAFGVGSNMHGH